MYKIAALSRAEIIILLSILDKGNIMISDVVGGRMRMSNTTVYRALRTLESLGLLETEKTKDVPPRKRIRLTEKGMKVATLLKRIEETL